MIHDYLYVAWRSVPGRKPSGADRKFADAVMREAMRAAEVCCVKLSYRLAPGVVMEETGESHYCGDHISGWSAK